MSTLDAQQPGAPETAAQPIAAEKRSRRLGGTARTVMAAVLVMVIVVAGVVLALSYPRDRAYHAQLGNRADVVRVAERFTTEANDYDIASIGNYQKRIAPLLTTKFRGEFHQAMQNIVAKVRSSKMTSHGQVLASAVSGIDQDSATVLVVADAKVKSVYDTMARHFRWKVSLVKVQGRWLVDDFQPID